MLLYLDSSSYKEVVELIEEVVELTEEVVELVEEVAELIELLDSNLHKVVVMLLYTFLYDSELK